MENLNLNEISHHNQTVITLISNTKTAPNSMKILKKESINTNGIDTIALKKGEKKIKIKKKEVKKA